MAIVKEFHKLQAMSMLVIHGQSSWQAKQIKFNEFNSTPVHMHATLNRSAEQISTWVEIHTVRDML